MSFIRKHSRVTLVAITCLAVGAGAGAITSAGASTGARAHHAARGHGLRGHRLHRLAQRAVHGQLVVPTRHGFATVTFDRGKVDSVNGRQLTMTEGTRSATYRTVTLTIPATARIRDNRRAASLSTLTPGQRVIVVVAPQRTFVHAHNARSR